MLLGLSTGALNIIEHDNRDKAELCCSAMFEKWLEIDQNASWKTLSDDAGIELPSLAYNGSMHVANYSYSHFLATSCTIS